MNSSWKPCEIVLSECIESPAFLLDCRSVLKPDDFADEMERRGWLTINEMQEKNEPISMESLADKYDNGAWIVAVANWFSARRESKAREALESLINESDMRYAYNSLSELLESAKDFKDPKDFLDKVNTVVYDASGRHIMNTGYIGDTAMDDYDELHRSRKNTIKFGLKEVDDMMGGLQKGHFVIVGARPGGGKSAIMLYPAIEMAKTGQRACILTIEMERKEVLERILANISGVTMNHINGTDKPSIDEGRAIADAIAATRNWKLSIIDEGCSTLSDIERMLARAKLSGDPIRLLCIDHFGLIQPDRRGKSRYEEYTEISNRVKVIAKKYQCTILCLCQMNRVKDSFSRPSMEDLRDTGSLEQDADKIMFLNRVKDSPDLTEITLAKNRQGALAECRMRFIGSLMRFTRA